MFACLQLCIELSVLLIQSVLSFELQISDRF